MLQELLSGIRVIKAFATEKQETGRFNKENARIININFRPNPPIDPMRVIELLQKNRNIKLVGNEKLRIERALPEPAARAQLVRELLRSLGQPLAAAVALAA